MSVESRGSREVAADEVDEQAEDKLKVGVRGDRVLDDSDGGGAWAHVMNQAEENVVRHALSPGA